MDVSQLQARIDAISWYHEFDFGNGLKARSNAEDVEWHRRLWRFMQEQLDAIDFRGKTVLDIGCWDGYWSFYAEKRGAKEILAVDDFSQNWSREEGILLAKELLNSRIEINPRVSVYELGSLGRTFDIVLFLGVYYHLVDPYHAFAQVRQCCHAKTEVYIEGNETRELPASAAVFNPEVPGSKFLPETECLRSMLRAAYLSVGADAYLAPPPTALARIGWCWRLWMCREALLGSRPGVREAVQALFGPPPTPAEPGRQVPYAEIRRVFLTCTPFEGESAAHVYRPPFGLHRFDPRFRSQPSG
jgi:tRNA (mo5U34)-methyltransferase